jgi:hypothetical protein
VRPQRQALGSFQAITAWLEQLEQQHQQVLQLEQQQELRQQQELQLELRQRQAQQRQALELQEQQLLLFYRKRTKQLQR